MSKIKKVLAVFLTLAMVLGMGMTTFAADSSATITVSGKGISDIEEGDSAASIKYVQIVEPDQNSTIGWKFVDDDVRAAFLTAYDIKDGATEEEKEAATKDALNALIGDAETGDGNANAEAGTIHSSEKLSNALLALTDKAVTEAESNIINVNSAGLYLITASKVGYTYSPMLAYVQLDADGNLVPAEVAAKGDKNTTSKTVEDAGQSVSKGDRIEYTVKVQYPYFLPTATDKTFRVVDTVTNAAFENDYNLTVTVDGQAADVIPEISKTVKDNDTLTITFNTYDTALAGKSVEIKYTVTVGDVSAESPLSNDVTTTMGSDSSQAIVISHPVKFQVQKVGDNNKPLPGAEFTLYVAAEEKDENAVELKVDGQTVYGLKVGVLEETNEVGTYEIDGLDADKTYYVKETKAPSGYSVNDTVFELKRDKSKDTDLTHTDTVDNVVTITTEHLRADFNSQTVTDTKLSALPSTGGIGTTIFTIGGCLIMIIAAALFFASRRKEHK